MKRSVQAGLSSEETCFPVLLGETSRVHFLIHRYSLSPLIFTKCFHRYCLPPLIFHFKVSRVDVFIV